MIVPVDVQEGEKRLLAFTKRGTTLHSASAHFFDLFLSIIREGEILSNKECFLFSFLQDFSYKQGDYLLFGSETSGLPAEALEDCKNQAFGGGTLRIPMVETYVRCLNLSVSVGIAIYEASRQLNYQQLQLEPEGCTNNNEQSSIITEDLFA